MAGWVCCFGWTDCRYCVLECWVLGGVARCLDDDVMRVLIRLSSLRLDVV